MSPARAWQRLSIRRRLSCTFERSPPRTPARAVEVPGAPPVAEVVPPKGPEPKGGGALMRPLSREIAKPPREIVGVGEAFQVDRGRRDRRRAVVWPQRIAELAEPVWVGRCRRLNW